MAAVQVANGPVAGSRDGNNPPTALENEAKATLFPLKAGNSGYFDLIRRAPDGYPFCDVQGARAGASLDTYYLYFLDSNRRIQAREDLTVSTREAAIAAAEKRRDGRAMELWLRAQMVWSCEATPFRR